MKVVKVYFMALMKDEASARCPYLIKFENHLPFYMEFPYESISPMDEPGIVRKELTRNFLKDMYPGKVTLNIMRAKLVAE